MQAHIGLRVLPSQDWKDYVEEIESAFHLPGLRMMKTYVISPLYRNTTRYEQLEAVFI